MDSKRLIVITGGGSGIGRATALLCAQRGDNVAVLDRTDRTAQEVAEQAIERGASGAIGLACNVQQESDLERAFEHICHRFGPPYGIFANAGIDHSGVFHELPLDNWNDIIGTNLTGVFLTCKYGLNRMLTAGVGGSIVCSSSPAGFVALASGGTAAYSASKAGISALVRCLALDYARFGIRVNALVPGATETGMMWNNVKPADIEPMREKLNHEIPLGRLAQPEDPARAALWLLSDESSYVTGSHLICDGGILAKASITV